MAAAIASLAGALLLAGIGYDLARRQRRITTGPTKAVGGRHG